MVGGYAIVHVRAQHPILDQGGALGGRTLVIDVEGAAVPGQGAVVDDGDEARCDRLVEEGGIDGGPLAVEVGLQTVTDGFVQQNAGGAGSQNHGHLPGRGALGLEQDHGAINGLSHHFPYALVTEGIDSLTAGYVAAMALAHAVFERGDAAAQGAHGTAVSTEDAVAGGDEHALIAVRPVHGDVLHGLLHVPGHGLGLLQKGQSLVGAHLLPGAVHGVVVGRVCELDLLRRRPGGVVGNGGGRAGRGEHGVQIQVLREGVPYLVAGDGADPDSLLNAGVGTADNAVLKGERGAPDVLEVQVGEVGAAAHGSREHPLDGGFIHTEPGHEGMERGLGHVVSFRYRAHARHDWGTSVQLSRCLR